MSTMFKLGVGALCLSAISQVEAVSCTFATGSCTPQPCPGNTLDEWGQCITAPAAQGCPAGCTLIRNSVQGQPGLCGLQGATQTTISPSEINDLQTCFAAPNQACVLSGITLLESTGCTDCLTDILELQGRVPLCTATTMAACEAINTPCEGEVIEPPSPAPRALPRQPAPVIPPRSAARAPAEPTMAPMEAPMDAPMPGPMMAPGPAPTPGVFTPFGDTPESTQAADAGAATAAPEAGAARSAMGAAAAGAVAVASAVALLL